MIEKINVTIEATTNEAILAQVGPLVLKIFVPNPYDYQVGKQYLINTVLEIKFDRGEINLYGFTYPLEKDLYLKLRNVQGLGPKTCLLMLARDSAERLSSEIAQKNIVYLSSFPRIGKQTAEKIILELAPKLKNSNYDNFPEHISLVADTLKSFGYNQGQIKMVLKQLDINEHDIGVLIKNALRVITNE